MCRNERVFRTQALLYVFAAVTVGVPNVKTLRHLSAETAALGAAHGVLTLPAQGPYTAALKTIPVSSCAMVYSFGFVIPAVFGTLACKEPVSPAKICSVLLCAAAVVFSAPRGGERAKGNALATLLLVIAMIASGGLRMVQKRQQRSACAAQTGAFLRTAFFLAGAVSALAAAAEKRRGHAAPPQEKRVYRFAAAVGAAMGGADTANTLLAGILPSIVVFPVTNVGVISASLAAVVLFLKERLTKRRAVAACFGIAAVVLFSLPL